jgi:predicted transcriptional regulator
MNLNRIDRLARRLVGVLAFRIVPGTEGKYRVDEGGEFFRQLPLGRWKHVKKKVQQWGPKSGDVRVIIQIYLKEGKRQMMAAPLVLSAFGNPRPIGSEPFYKDEDRTNLNINNLAWAPKGTSAIGKDRSWLLTPEVREKKRRKQAVLDEEKVALARELYRQGQSVSALAEHFEVSEPTMTLALTGKTWAHVPNPVEIRSQEESQHRGSLTPTAQLDEEDVIEVRNLSAQGWSQSQIARHLGVAQATIQKLLSGKSWKHVPDPVIKAQI